MPRLSKAQRARIREIQRDFHVRAFGEELAHVNLDMTIEERHRWTLLQLSCIWNLSQPPVQSVIPTLIQEVSSKKSIEDKVDELAALPEGTLSPEESQEILRIGDNKGCMSLKGGNPEFLGDPLPDRWPMTPELEKVAQRWGIAPKKDLVCTHC